MKKTKISSPYIINKKKIIDEVAIDCESDLKKQLH